MSAGVADLMNALPGSCRLCFIAGCVPSLDGEVDLAPRTKVSVSNHGGLTYTDVVSHPDV